jgi:hypothetical protein
LPNSNPKSVQTTHLSTLSFKDALECRRDILEGEEQTRKERCVVVSQNIAVQDFENWGRKEREMDSSFSLKIMLAGLVSFSNGSIDMIS